MIDLRRTRVQQIDGALRVAVAPRRGQDDIIVTHNWCDKCTWYHGSERVTNQTLTDSGDGLTFTSGSPFWIDAYTGRIPQDDKVSNWDVAYGEGHGYLIEVKVDGVTATKCPAFLDEDSTYPSDGDYWIDFESGDVVFLSSQSGKTVTASYSKATNDSTWVLAPPAGYTYIIINAECDFSQELEMTDQFVYGAFAPVELVAPELTPDPFPAGTLLPVGNEDTYKRAVSLAVEAAGNFPTLEPIGSTTAQRAWNLDKFRRRARGMKGPMQAMPFLYEATTDLDGDYGIQLHVWLASHTPYVGENAFVTFRIIVAANT